jgi:UDP-N-acetylmuramate--alanine ligase
MSGLAMVATELGAEVSGSDVVDGPHLPLLRAVGMVVTIGHRSSAVPAAGEVVYSSAVPPDNVERAAGRAGGLEEIGRGQLLAEAAALRPCIAVAGTHGKTTTAAMIVHGLRRAGIGCGYVIGGDLLPGRRGAEWGEGWLVVETDESDRSLLALRPEIAVITEVDLDHVETFSSVAEVEDIFGEFVAGAARRVLPAGSSLAARPGPPVRSYSTPDLTLDPSGATFVWHGKTVRSAMNGAHNARNAAAALEACFLAGADAGACAAAPADYPGVARRFEPVGTTLGGARVYDDYAHHPTEVAATLAAARTLRPGRLVVVLRPWGARRTAVMAGAYGRALGEADLVVLLDVAGDDRRGGPAGVTSRLILDAAAVASPGRPVLWIPDVEEAGRLVSSQLRESDVCLTFGCADMGAWLASEGAPREPVSVGRPGDRSEGASF